MLIASAGFPNRDSASYLARSTNFLDRKIRLATSVIFQGCHSTLSFFDTMHQYLTGRSVVVSIPKVVGYFVTNSVKTSISDRQKEIDQGESLTWHFLLAKMAIKTATCSVILFFFSRSVPHLFSLHKQSKNSLKYLYFIYQLYMHIDLIRVFRRGEAYYLGRLAEMGNTVEQLQKKYTFEEILTNQNQEVVRVWFKNNGKILSDEQIQNALTKFFPETLSIHDLSISLEEQKFGNHVIPKISHLINKINAMNISIQNFQTNHLRLEINDKKKQARQFFKDLNTYSQSLFKIKTQLEQVPEPSLEIKCLLTKLINLYKSIEPEESPSHMDSSPRNTLLDHIFKGFGRENPELIFDDSEEPWVVLFAGGPNPFSLTPPSFPNPFSKPQHPIEKIQEFLNSLGIRTVKDLKDQRILTTDADGFSTVSEKYFILSFVKKKLQPIFNVFLRNKILRIEALVEKFLSTSV